MFAAEAANSSLKDDFTLCQKEIAVFHLVLSRGQQKQPHLLSNKTLKECSKIAGAQYQWEH